MSTLARAGASLPMHVVQDRVVQRLLEAEKALGVAVGIDQVKLVMDVSAAQEVFAKRQQLGEEVIGYAHTIKIRALARLGELLKELEKAKGVAGRSKKGQTRGSAGIPRVNEPPTLADLGVSKKVSSVAQQLAALPAATREAIAQRETTIAKVRQEQHPPAAEDDEDDDIEGDIEPANWEGAFLMRADLAVRLAVYARGPITDDVVRFARSAALAWTRLADELEKRGTA